VGISNILLREVHVFGPEEGEVPTDGKKLNNGDLQIIIQVLFWCTNQGGWV
jgi:hypothetical protein